MPEYNVIDVSSYIINYSNQINHPINNLKLQKLLYYVQAATLVETGRKCFNSKIIAWQFGPVVSPKLTTSIIGLFLCLLARFP